MYISFLKTLLGLIGELEYSNDDLRESNINIVNILDIDSEGLFGNFIDIKSINYSTQLDQKQKNYIIQLMHIDKECHPVYYDDCDDYTLALHQM